MGLGLMNMNKTLSTNLKMVLFVIGLTVLYMVSGMFPDIDHLFEGQSRVWHNGVLGISIFITITYVIYSLVSNKVGIKIESGDDISV